MKRIIDTLYETADLNDEDIRQLLEADSSVDEYLFQRADYRRQEIYGRDVYLRGLIEFTNFCKNDCYYCGIRRGNRTLENYFINGRYIKSNVISKAIEDAYSGFCMPKKYPFTCLNFKFTNVFVCNLSQSKI